MKRIGGLLVLLLALLLQAPEARAEEDWAGDWNGTLVTPRGALRLLLTIHRGADGALSAELESLDQAPGQKIPVAPIAIADGRLSFSIPAIRASYEGVWNAATQRFAGTFTQGMGMQLDFARGAGEARPTLTGLDGIWDAAIVRNGARLPFVLHVTTNAAGTIASLDSPALLAYGLPVTELRREGQVLSFAVPAGESHFRGTIAADRISGIWSRVGEADAETSFVRRANAAAAPRRPQLPRPPFPYRTEEVRIPNPHAPGVTLAGTLTLPQGRGPFAAAILITGSGPQDRDESLLGHRPFLVLADRLTRAGIAVLRFDDRGTAASTGDFAGATSADFATDANAAFAFLRARHEVDPHAIGFIGHNEGGMIGPIAARDNPDLAWLVLLAGPGASTRHLLDGQRRAVARSQGVTDAQLDASQPLQNLVLDAAASTDSAEAVTARLRAALAGLGLGEEQRARVIQQATDPWFRYFLRYDPAPNLARLRIPVLAINGSLDQQVIAADNLPGIRAALRDDPDATVRELPGLNHLFQHARTGAVGEYAEIEETMAPEALDLVASWINARFPRRAHPGRAAP